MCEGVRVSVCRGGTVRVGRIQRPGGLGLGSRGCVWGACVGHWAGWECREAWGSCDGGVWAAGWSGAVRLVRREGLRRVCVGDRAGGEACVRGPGLRAMVGVCGALNGEWGGRGRGFRLGSRASCPPTCPLAAARLCGVVLAGSFGGGGCRLPRPQQGFRR